MNLFEVALWAAEKHKDQRRKGKCAAPYINHLLEVAALASNATFGNSLVITAALLHDVIEDQDVTLAEVREKFGAQVAYLIEEVTDDKSLPKLVRKKLQIKRASGLSYGAKAIRIADMVANLRDTVRDPPVGWTCEDILTYVKHCEDIFIAADGRENYLEREFKDASENARSYCKRIADAASVE